jgi:AcrR family transcriptional regulator
MPRPRSLTPEVLASAALAVIDRDGLAALSMRAVAVELGMSTMGLYRYVDDRAALEDLVADVVLAEVDLRVPSEAHWRECARLLVERMRAAAIAHPAALPLLVTRRHAAPSQLRWIEAMLRVLTAAGFAGRERVIALRALVGYTLGALRLQHLGPLAGAGTEAMARLPASTYPLLVETAGEARRLSLDAEFRGGLDALLRGLGHDAETP